MWLRSLADEECLLELQEGGVLFIRRGTRELIFFYFFFGFIIFFSSLETYPLFSPTGRKLPWK
jgi:hypothetical protein